MQVRSMFFSVNRHLAGAYPAGHALCLRQWLYDVLQLSHLAVWGSIGSWFLFLAVYPYMWPTIDLAPEMVGMVGRYCQLLLKFDESYLFCLSHLHLAQLLGSTHCNFTKVFGWEDCIGCHVALIAWWSLHFAWVVDDARCIVVARIYVSVCVSVCLSASVRPHCCTDPDVTWGHCRGCPLVVHYWADLQSGHGLRCYSNITWTLVTSLHPFRDMTT